MEYSYQNQRKTQKEFTTVLPLKMKEKPQPPLVGP